MKYNQGVCIVVLMILIPHYSTAEENPFHLEKEFQVMDKVEESLFSTMTQELQKDAVSPTKTTIDFRAGTPTHTRQEDTPQPMPSILYTKTQKQRIIQEQKEKLKRDKKKGLERKNRDRSIDIALKEQRKRALLRLQKKKYLKLWTQEDIVDIDIEKERRLYQKKLDREYQKAVIEVGKIQ